MGTEEVTRRCHTCAHAEKPSGFCVLSLKCSSYDKWQSAESGWPCAHCSRACYNCARKLCKTGVTCPFLAACSGCSLRVPPGEKKQPETHAALSGATLNYHSIATPVFAVLPYIPEERRAPTDKAIDPARDDRVKSLVAHGEALARECGQDKALRFNTDKLRVDLIPPEAIFVLAAILSAGAVKYADRNWEKFDTIPDPDAYFGGSQLRHFLYNLLGRKADPESGCPEAWHILCNAAMRVTYDIRKAHPDQDERLAWMEQTFKTAISRAKAAKEANK